MQVVLIMLRNGGERRSFSVVRNLTTIGRREDCDLRIPVGDVSRKHCRLVLSADNLRVQDLGSSNGTFVNGQQVQDAFLNAGDTVSVGPVNFVVQVDGVPAEDVLDAPAGSSGDTGAGGTAVALAALTAAPPAEPDGADVGDVAEVSGLLEPMPAPAADEDLFSEDAAYQDPSLEPVAAGAGDGIGERTESAAFDPSDEPATVDELGLDELPAGSADPVAFDHVELDEGGAATAPVSPPPAPKTDDGDWEFLIEDSEGGDGDADLQVDLDQPHGH